MGRVPGDRVGDGSVDRLVRALAADGAQPHVRRCVLGEGAREARTPRGSWGTVMLVALVALVALGCTGTGAVTFSGGLLVKDVPWPPTSCYTDNRFGELVADPSGV